MKSIKLVGLVLVLALNAFAQGTSFTYQGSLKAGGIDANGSHDFEFALFNAESGGSQLGSTLIQNGVAVTNGIFAVTLDFGNQFPGASRFLEIRVRQTGGGPFTTLSPRQPVSATPYAIKSVNSDAAATATNATQLGGVAAAQFVQTADPRLSDARPPTAGSSNYIQNTTTLQSLSNFNISGTGTANVFNSTSDYNIFGFRVLSILGANNAFVGVGAGTANTGSQNAFFGREAGEDNTTGSRNSFFGGFAGRNNLTASDLAFFGADSGAANSMGVENSFFGSQAGRSNTIGLRNSFFGKSAGQTNFSGGNNSFFGASAGEQNISGGNNVFVGVSSGLSNMTGGGNSFFGVGAGLANTTGNANTSVGNNAGNNITSGSNNTTIGTNSDVLTGDLTFATAIGSGAVATTSSSVTIGRAADTVRIPGDLTLTGTFAGNLPAGSANYIQNTTSPQSTSNFNVSGTGTAGIFNATTQYNIGGNRILSNAGSSNLFAGAGSGAANTGFSNSFFGALSGDSNTFGNSNSYFGAGSGEANTGGSFNSLFGARSGEDLNGFFSNSFFGADSGRRTNSDGNSFFGASSGVLNTTGDNNSFFGLNSGRLNDTGNFNSFFGYYSGEANTTGSNNTTIGTEADVGSGGLTFATAIGAGAVVNSSNRIQLGRQDGSDDVRVSGNLLLATLGSAGTTTLCRNIFQQVATCSSSLRYKTNISKFGLGLNLVKQLQPITFDWKEGGLHDLGLGAEDVAAIEPLLVTYNTKGEVEGVKYDRIGVVLVNAVKEQQQTIERQQKQIDALKALVCASNREAAFCKGVL